jgi:dihydrofolate reductase
MRGIAVTAFASLDGVMQAPGGPEEDRSGGFAHGGWSVPAWDDVMLQSMGTAMAGACDFLLGRRTYEIFAAHWPYVTDPDDKPMGEKLTAATKYVVSTTLTSADWANTTLLNATGDALAERMRQLKEADGPELLTQGSAQLVRFLSTHGLVDEYRLWIYPVVLGRGKRWFDDGLMPAGLELVDLEKSSTGVLLARYRRSGPVPSGSFALETPTEAELARRAAVGS